MSEKMWGSEPFWGLGYDWDPDWVLTDRQKELRATLIELCEKEMRANAKRSDDELLFPRRNLELLGEHGFLGLTVPEEYGGLGENHVAFSMTCETIARYGCASTAMCYVMHIGAVQAIMLRPTPALTLGVLATMLVVYKTGAIKPTENFKLGVIAATGAIALVYLATFVLRMFGIGVGFMHSGGWLSIVVGIVVVVVAALNLVLDFDFIEQGAARGAPKYMEWYGAFGLLVTLVWLYLEILRLLANLNRRR